MVELLSSNCRREIDKLKKKKKKKQKPGPPQLMEEHYQQQKKNVFSRVKPNRAPVKIMPGM